MKLDTNVQKLATKASTRLAQVADTLSQHAAVGRLGQVCGRWIYSACLCFGLNLAEQARSGFACSYVSCPTACSMGCRCRPGSAPRFGW